MATNYKPATAQPIIDGETRMADIDLYYARVAMANCLNHLAAQLHTNEECGHEVFTVADALDSARIFFDRYVKEA